MGEPRRGLDSLAMVIAIDGPAGAGKSTVAKGVAATLGFSYLDSGAMYRCVALACQRSGTDLDDASAAGEVAQGLEIDPGPPATLDGADVEGEIRTAAVSAAASRIARHPKVREAMVAIQRNLLTEGNWVAEGRDIGTVVAPGAELKVFLDADPRERARRRAADEGRSPDEVLDGLAERDTADQRRRHGALKEAEGAVRIDSTGSDAEAVVERIATLARGLGAG